MKPTGAIVFHDFADARQVGGQDGATGGHVFKELDRAATLGAVADIAGQRSGADVGPGDRLRYGCRIGCVFERQDVLHFVTPGEPSQRP